MFKVAPPEMRKSNRCFCVSMDNFRLEHQLKASNFSFENYLLGRKRRLKVAGTFKKFVYWPWSPVCIYWPSPTILLPARGLSLNILTLSPQFVFVFAALAHDLYYRSVTWICIYLIIGSNSSGSSNSCSSDFFGTNSTNICMPILVH